MRPRDSREPHSPSPAPQCRLPPSRSPAFAGCVLSLREIEVVRQLARGLTYAQVADATGRRTSTVRSLVSQAKGRLGVSTLAEAVAICMQAGWLDVVDQDGQAVALADPRVTWAQRLYLEAFDQSLAAGDDPQEVARTRQLREAALTGMCREAGLERPWRAMAGDPLERIAQTLRRLDESRRAA